MFMDSYRLKLIAVISMLIDHTGFILFPDALWLRMIGRLAFPIYTFLLVEGFYHTKNVKKYLGRLFAFALISEIPYNLALYNHLFYLEKQNVYWTLALGLLMLVLLKRFKQPFVQAAIIAGASLVAEYCHFSYRYVGILMILCFYIFRINPGSRDKQLEIRFMQILSVFTLNYSFLSSIQWIGGLSLLPIQFYNGQKGRHSFQYFFYIFYPAHLLGLYLLKRYI